MYEDYDEHWDDKPTNTRSRKIGFGCISLLLVFALLLSGLSSLYWAWSQGNEANATAVPPPTTDEPTEQPDETVITTDTLITATAVSEIESTSIPPTLVPITLNRIVYINEEGQVITIAPDGRDERILTDQSQFYQFPAWSPDGEYVAAIGGSREGSGVYILRDTDQPGSQEQYFSRNENPIYLYWSPEGNQLGFIANNLDNGIGLYLTSVDDAESQLLATGAPFYWHWTADGQQLLIHAGADSEQSRLTLIDMNGDENDEIAAPGDFQSPAISANGRYWAYAEALEAGLSWLTVLDTETGEIYQDRHAGQVAIGWSPTNDQLAMISGRPESNDFRGPLRVMDAYTGKGRLLSQDYVFAFFWSPDGRSLAYISLPRANEDIVAQANSLRARRTLSRLNTAPLLQPFPHQFELRVVDVATGEDRLLTRFQPTFMFLSQFLPYFDQYAHSHRLWSPDSNAIVLPIRDEGENQVTVMPVNGDEKQVIAEGDMAFWSQQ